MVSDKALCMTHIYPSSLSLPYFRPSLSLRHVCVEGRGMWGGVSIHVGVYVGVKYWKWPNGLIFTPVAFPDIIYWIIHLCLLICNAFFSKYVDCIMYSDLLIAFLFLFHWFSSHTIVFIFLLRLQAEDPPSVTRYLNTFCVYLSLCARFIPLCEE